MLNVPVGNKVTGRTFVSKISKPGNSTIRDFQNRKNSKRYDASLTVVSKATTAKSIKGASKDSTRIKMFLKEW